jgi:hypothetical protein
MSDGNKEKPSIDILPQAPVPHCPLKARVWMLYEQRHIEAERKYYDEARQTMTFIRDSDETQDVEIVSADDVSPAVWSLKICNGKCDPNGNDKNLQAHVSPGGQPRDLVFTDYGLSNSLIGFGLNRKDIRSIDCNLVIRWLEAH